MNVLSKFPPEHSDGTLEGLAQHGVGSVKE